MINNSFKDDLSHSSYRGTQLPLLKINVTEQTYTRLYVNFMTMEVLI